MNVVTLREAVQKAGIDPSDYRIMSAPDDSTLCILKYGKVWQVFYFERGVKRRLRRFNREDEACAYFLEMLDLAE